MIPFSKLKNKRVLVTRPKHQAKEVIAKLWRAGAKVIHIPLIEIADPSDNFRSLDRAISRLDKYDWLIFTSQNAVTSFFNRLNKLRRSSFVPRPSSFVPRPSSLVPRPSSLVPRPSSLQYCSWIPKIAAVGPPTAAVLKKHGIRKVIIPRKDNYSTDGLVEVLKRYKFEDKHVLFPCAKKARETLPTWLKKQGAKLHKVEAYQTMMPKNIGRARLSRLIKENKVDVVLFYSASAKHNFIKIIGRKVAKEFKARLNSC